MPDCHESGLSNPFYMRHTCHGLLCRPKLPVQGQNPSPLFHGSPGCVHIPRASNLCHKLSCPFDPVKSPLPIADRDCGLSSAGRDPAPVPMSKALPGTWYSGHIDSVGMAHGSSSRGCAARFVERLRQSAPAPLPAGCNRLGGSGKRSLRSLPMVCQRTRASGNLGVAAATLRSGIIAIPLGPGVPVSRISPTSVAASRLLGRQPPLD